MISKELKLSLWEFLITCVIADLIQKQVVVFNRFIFDVCHIYEGTIDFSIKNEKIKIRIF